MADGFMVRMDPGMTDAEALYRDVWNLCSIRKGSLPLNRGFGLSWDMLSMPEGTAEGMFTAEVMEQVDRYVPEASVSRVAFSYDAANGKAVPEIHVERRG